jgi:hypothetical protein
MKVQKSNRDLSEKEKTVASSTTEQSQPMCPVCSKMYEDPPQ